MKIAIGVPSGDMLHADFAMNLVNLVAMTISNGVGVGVINQKSSVVEIGRCELVRAAQGIQADRLLFLDSDMTFAPDTLLRLLAHEKEIVGCDAMKRREPFHSVVIPLEGGRFDHKAQSGLQEAAALSTACLLVDMPVFDKIPGVPFQVPFNEDKKVFLGEDYYFSSAARRAGCRLWCDLDTSQGIGHIGTRTFYLPRYESKIVTLR